MADNSGLGWSDAQWEMVNNTVSESFAKASVASAFLPRYGPLPGSAENVRKEKLRAVDANTIKVTDDATLKLFNLRVLVELSSEQVADDALSSALLAFRRAANTLAQAEDDIVFNGYQSAATPPGGTSGGAQGTTSATSFASAFVASEHPKRSKGLSDPKVRAKINKTVRKAAPTKSGGSLPDSAGQEIVAAVVAAIGELEKTQNPGPFASVLGEKLFQDAHTPNAVLILPADRITPMLNGPLLRSGRLSPNRGIVVSLSSGAIDIVVATPPKVQFLQQRTDAKYLFRVYERFVLRIKDDQQPAVQDFEIK